VGESEGNGIDNEVHGGNETKGERGHKGPRYVHVHIEFGSLSNNLNKKVDDVVDDVWPEIKEEIEYNVLMSMHEPYVEIPHRTAFALFLPIIKIRNWYLYST
jgi:hypothetical protein